MNEGTINAYNAPAQVGHGRPLARSGGAAQGQSPPSSSPIRDRITNAESLLSAIHDCISALEERLTPALEMAPPDPSAVPTGIPPHAASSQLSMRLMQHTQMLDAALQRLQGIMHRVEL